LCMKVVKHDWSDGQFQKSSTAWVSAFKSALELQTIELACKAPSCNSSRNINRCGLSHPDYCGICLCRITKLLSLLVNLEEFYPPSPKITPVKCS
jgi:hypothetical protein